MPTGDPSGRRVGLALVLASAAAFGSLAVLGKYAYAAGLDVAEVLAVRFALAAPVLWVLAWLTRRSLRAPWAVAARLLALGAVGYALQAVLFFGALTRISASLTGLLLYLYPALVALAAALLGRHRLDRATLLGLVLALAGTALVLGVPGERLDPLGVGLGLAAAFWYTGYLLVSEQLLRGVDTLVAGAWVTTGAALSIVVVGGGGLRLLDFAGTRPSGWAAAAAMATVATAVPIAALFAGMRRIGSTWASIASSFEPVFTVTLGVAVLGEPLGAAKVVGGAAVVTGAVVVPLLRAHQTFLPQRARAPGVLEGGSIGAMTGGREPD